MKTLTGGPKGSPQDKPRTKPFHFSQEQKPALLTASLQHFFSTSSYSPQIGLEFEFYILQSDRSQLKDQTMVDQFIVDLVIAAHQHPLIYKIEKEQGMGQIEVKFLHTTDILKLCENLKYVKKEAQHLASQKGLIAAFDAQIFENDCGSALQFNLSLHNQKTDNVFAKNSDLLLSVVTALLLDTKAMMPLLASSHQDRKRLDKDRNAKLHQLGKYTAPVNLSYGINNRTCAIRIVGGRLEYRVAGANCDPYLVTLAILEAMLRGITQTLKPIDFGFQEIYGNAFDDQYHLKLLTA